MPARKKLQEPFFNELRKVEEGWKSLPLKLKARRHHWLQSSAWVFFSAGRAIASLVAGGAPPVGWHQAPKPCASANWGGHRACPTCQDYQGLQVCKCEVVAKQLKPRGSEGRCWGDGLVHCGRWSPGQRSAGLGCKILQWRGLQRLFGSRPQMRNRQVGGACHLAWAKGSGVFLGPYSRTTALLAPRDLRQLTKQGRNCYWHCRGRKSCGPGVGQDACFPSSPFAFIEEVGHHEGHASQIEMQRCATCEQGRHDGKLSSQLDPVAKQGGNGPNWLSIRSFHLMSSRQPFECRCQAKSKPGGHDVAYPERYRCRDFEAYDSTYVGLSGWQDGSGQMFF